MVCAFLRSKWYVYTPDNLNILPPPHQTGLMHSTLMHNIERMEHATSM